MSAPFEITEDDIGVEGKYLFVNRTIPHEKPATLVALLDNANPLLRRAVFKSVDTGSEECIITTRLDGSSAYFEPGRAQMITKVKRKAYVAVRLGAVKAEDLTTLRLPNVLRSYVHPTRQEALDGIGQSAAFCGPVHVFEVEVDD